MKLGYYWAKEAQSSPKSPSVWEIVEVVEGDHGLEVRTMEWEFPVPLMIYTDFIGPLEPPTIENKEN